MSGKRPSKRGGGRAGLQRVEGAEHWGFRWGAGQGISREGTQPARGITDEGGARDAGGATRQAQTPVGEPEADGQVWEAWHSGPAE